MGLPDFEMMEIVFSNVSLPAMPLLCVIGDFASKIALISILQALPLALFARLARVEYFDELIFR